MTPPLPRENTNPPSNIEESWVPIEGNGDESGVSNIHETSDFQDAPPGQTPPPPILQRHIPTRLAFDLEELIAVGGFGEVWRGKQRSLGRMVALKRLRRDIIKKLEFDVSALRRYEEAFTHEAVIAASLEHPNIVPIHDLGHDEEGYPLLAMKLVVGKPWNRLIREEFEQPVEDFLDRHLPILASVAQATAFAHSQGVIHRDIKPSQIMVGNFGEVQLMDWGLALRIEDLQRELEESEEEGPNFIPTPGVLSTCGTIAFMAPEQARRTLHLMSPLTDVYLLGGTLYYLLTGRPPRSADTSREAFKLACEGVVIHPMERTTRPIPEALADLAMRSMSEHQKDRPASVVEFLRELHEFISSNNKPDTNPTGRVEMTFQLAMNTMTPIPKLAGKLKHEDEFDTEEIRPAALGRRASTVLENLFSSLFTKLSSLGRMDLLEESAVDLVDYLLSVPQRPDESETVGTGRSALLYDASRVLMAQSRFDLAHEALLEAERLTQTRLNANPESSIHTEELSRILSLTTMNCIHMGKDHDGWIAAKQSRALIEKLAMEEERHRWEPILTDRIRLEGFVQWKMGNLRQARELLEETHGIQEQILTKATVHQQSYEGLARTCNNLAWVYRLCGLRNEALSMMRRCHELWCRVASETRNDIRCKVNWQWSMRSLGLIHEHYGDFGEAVYWYETSLTISRQMSEADPGNPQRRSEVATSLYGMGRNFLALGDLRRGETCCREAVKHLGETAPRNPEKGRAVRDYIGSMITLGETLLELGRTEEARSIAELAFTEAKRRTRVSHISPVLPAALEGRALLLMGKVHLAARHPKKAREAFQSGIELLKPIMRDGVQGPDITETWVALLLLLGERDSAQPELDRLKKIHWNGWELLRLEDRTLNTSG